MIFKSFFNLTLLVSLFFFFMPLWAWDDEDEEKEYYDTCTLIYDGLRIECDAGCGSPDYDPDLKEINTLFTAHVKKLNDDAYECNYISGFYDEWQDKIWKQEDPHRYSVFCLATQNHSFDLTTAQHARFLETKVQFLTDFYFYNREILTHKKNYLKQQQQNLLLLKNFKERGYGFISQEENEEGFDVPVLTNSISLNAWDIDSAIQKCEQAIASTPEKILRKNEEFAHSSVELQETFAKIDQLFKNMFVWCLEHHQPEGIAFASSLESLIENDVYQALERVRFLISFSEKYNFKDDFLAKLYLLQGQVESEFTLFSDALISLTTAITKNPAETESYFERAAVYFELGQYEQALEDYLKSDLSNVSEETLDWLDIPALSAGVITGIQQASANASIEFVPGMIGSLRGVGHGLWAFALNPIQVGQKFCEAALQCVEFLKNTSTSKILKTLVPELKEFVEQYDQLSPFQRGSLIGTVIGKYGVEIFCGTSTTSGVKHYLKLKKANRLLTLEALARPEQKEKVIQAAAKRFAMREQVFSNKNRILKIHQGRQNKHIAGHENWIKTNSILIANPEKLLEKAGTGTKSLEKYGNSAHRLGTAGSQEIIDFGEVIGKYYDRDLEDLVSTTWAKIHYAKDNWVHIVPTKPR